MYLSMASASLTLIILLCRPGCFACLRILCPCDRPSFGVKFHRRDHRILSKARYYPISEEEILETWWERAISWESIHLREGREFRCNTQKLSRGMKYFDADSSSHLSILGDNDNEPNSGLYNHLQLKDWNGP
jgi:hypothetical protein